MHGYLCLTATDVLQFYAQYSTFAILPETVICILQDHTIGPYTILCDHAWFNHCITMYIFGRASRH